MKLRNKKTGDIWEFDEGFSMKASHDTAERAGAGGGVLTCYAYSLAELNENWEDAEPAEPLIKDEKIRKAVRAWLAIQEQPIVAVAITRNKDSDGFFDYCLYGYIEKARLSNGKPVVNKNLTAIDFEFRSLEKYEFERHRDYTIAELCGEEEE